MREEGAYSGGREMKYDNPAERLMLILDAGLKRKGDEPCIQVWHDLLETDGDKARLMTRLGKLMELPEQIIAVLREISPDAVTWDQWSTQVGQAFVNQNLAQSWQTFRHYIDQNTVQMLRLSSQLLHSKRASAELTAQNLSDIRQQVDTLIQQVISADDVPLELKQYIVAHLKKVQDAIDEYKITGAVAILESVEVMWGHMATDAAYRDFMRKTDAGTTLMDGLVAIASVVTIATGVQQLATYIQTLGLPA